MAIVEDALYAILTANSDVSGLVSLRVYPLQSPQLPVYPLIIYRRIGGNHGQHMTGGTGLGSARLEVASWGKKHSLAWALAENVRDALQGFTGSAGSVDVSAVILDGDSADSEQLATGREQFVYNVSHEYTFWFAESIPA